MRINIEKLRLARQTDRQTHTCKPPSVLVKNCDGRERAGLGKQENDTGFWRECIWTVKERASDNICNIIEYIETTLNLVE